MSATVLAKPLRYRWRDAVLASDMPPFMRLVALVVESFTADTRPTAWPSYAAIAARAGMARSTAVQWVDRLVSEGWLIRSSRGVRAGRGGAGGTTVNHYTLAIPASVIVRQPDDEAAVMVRQSDDDSGLIVRLPTPHSPAAGPEPLKEPLTNPTPQGGGGDRSDDDQLRQARSDLLQSVPGAKPSRSVTENLRRCLAAGWTVGQVAEDVNREGWTGAASVTAVLGYRLGLLADTTPPAPPKQPVPWCQQCDSAAYRYVTDPDGMNPKKCPTCHASVW